MVDIKCDYCNKYFRKWRSSLGKKLNFCCKDCNVNYHVKMIECGNCKKSVRKMRNEFMGSKSGFIFCSKSCAAIYNNTHKTTGNRRSKLESWIEKQLIDIFPNLNIFFNDKTSINSELDIYIPSLKIAFELNGIFHYEPIYGKDKLDKIKNNDVSKTKLCHENSIDLCIIDTSHQKRFTEKSSQEFLDIVVDIIKSRI